MNMTINIKILIVDLIGLGLSDATLRALIKKKTSLAADQINEVLLELQFSSAIIGAGGMWLPGHADVDECYSSEIVEQLLNPGEFVEVDVDQLIAELEALLVRARAKQG